MKIKKYTLLPIITLLAIIIIPSITNAAGPAETLINFAGGAIDGGISSVLNFFKEGLILILTIPVKGLLEAVMQYQNFFSAGVNAGWDATRNFANLFFALLLLFIAIATVLNIGSLDNYTAKRMLPNFIFAALFINFSKAIVGFLIDISQIIMVSFYNTFGTNLADVIGNASKLSEGAATVGGQQISASIISLFNIIIVIILIFVFLWTTVILAMRIVTLWFVIIISPLAFISFLVPPLKSLGNSWSQQLQSALVTGPVLMFLLYLAFLIMSTDFNGAPSGENLFSNGNLINYVLVIGLLVIANIEAQKAGNSAPGIVKSAVGVAGTVATFGLGAYVGAGGVGTGRMLKKGVELADKTAGGATRGVQVLFGGKINPNDRYELWKATNKDNTIKGKAFGGGWVGGIAQQTLGGEAGQKANYQKTQLKLAEEARQANTLNDNPILAKALASAEAEIIEKNKFEEDPDKIIKDIEKAISKADLVTARALTTHLNSLGKINKLFTNNSPFRDIAENYATEADQFAAFSQTYLQANDSQYDKSFLQRNKNIAKNKSGMEAFGSNASASIPNIGTIEGKPNTPQNSDLFKKYKQGSISNNAKKFSDNLFSTRAIDLNTNKFAFDQSGNAAYEFDIRSFDDFISNRSISELENPDTWKSMSQSLKDIIVEGLTKSGLQKNDPGNAAAAWRGIKP